MSRYRKYRSDYTYNRAFGSQASRLSRSRSFRPRSRSIGPGIVNRSVSIMPFGRYGRSPSYSRKRSRSSYSRGSTLMWGTTAGTKKKLLYKEAKGRARSNRRVGICRSIVLVPPRCRDKLICSYTQNLTATSGQGGTDNRLFSALKHLEVRGAHHPFAVIDNTGNSRNCAGFDLTMNRYNKFRVHGMSVVVKIRMDPTQQIIRWALVPMRGTTTPTFLTDPIDEICDGESSTHVSLSGNLVGGSSNTGYASLGASVGTGSLYGVSDATVSIEDDYESASKSTLPARWPLFVLYYQGKFISSEVAVSLMWTVTIDYEFTSPKTTADIDQAG